MTEFPLPILEQRNNMSNLSRNTSLKLVNPLKNLPLRLRTLFAATLDSSVISLILPQNIVFAENLREMPLPLLKGLGRHLLITMGLL
jgi:hypothetical protein